MQNTLDAIMAKAAEFKSDADKAAGGNKAAGSRSRKHAMELREMLKTWRKVSVVRE